MGSNTDNPLPPGRSSEETAKDFAEFFLNKICQIWQLFIGIPPYQQRKTDTQDLKALHHLNKKKVEEK